MSLQFEVFDAESGAFIQSGYAQDALVAELDELDDEHLSGYISTKKYLASLARLLAAAPDALDVHAHIANYLHEADNPKKALEAALAGLSVANRHIPEGFGGRIEWGHLENRAYLRIMQVALLSYMRLRRYKDAVKVIELMLVRNPDDNQGVRYLLGSALLQARDFTRACVVFEQGAAQFPPHWYDLALCLMSLRDMVRAATALRRGFAANPYIAEMLDGNPDPAPLAIWHSSSVAKPETAREYLRMSGFLWLHRVDSSVFLRWLFNHPMVLNERAEVMKCREALLWEEDSAARRALGQREARLIQAIDDTLSAAIVVKR